MHYLVCTIFAACLCTTGDCGDIIYVHFAAPGSQPDGSNWELAFRSVSEALNIAKSGDQVWVANGTYIPDDSLAQRNARFSVPTGVAMYGGFAGWETSLTERMIKANPTILSGDSGLQGDSTDNCYTVVFFDNPNSDNRLDGFIVERGNATTDNPFAPFNSPERNGGGVFIISSSQNAQIEIRNCLFRFNYAMRMGGAIYCEADNLIFPSIDSCLFERNHSGSLGGAVCIYSGLATKREFLTRSRFSYNSSAKGGGIFIQYARSDSIAIQDCVFEGNSGTYGSALNFDNPLNAVDFLEVRNCQFIDNVNTENGSSGTLSVDCDNLAIDKLLIRDCTFRQRPSIEGNTRNYGLSVSSFHHAIDIEIERTLFDSARITMVAGVNDLIKKGSVEFRNSTVCNVAGIGNFMFLQVADITFVNTKIIGNVSSIRAAGRIEIVNSLFARNSEFSIQARGHHRTLNISNSIFWGSPEIRMIADSFKVLNTLTDLPAFDSLFSFDGTEFSPALYVTLESLQFSTDPMFINEDNSIFQLRSCSPAINSGSNSIVDLFGVQSDLDENMRIVDELVDIGPYEHMSPFKLGIVDLQNVQCPGDDSGVVEFVANGVEPIILSWQSDTIIGARIENLPAGDHIFFLEDGELCKDSITLTILQPQDLVQTLTTNNIDCFGDSTGSVLIALTGGTPPFEISWSNGNAGANLLNVSSGEYTAIISDSNNCVSALDLVVYENTEIHVSGDISYPENKFTFDGAIEVSISGGVGPYTLFWDDGSVDTKRDSLSHGIYRVSVMDSIGCIVEKVFDLVALDTMSEPVEINVWPNPVLVDTELIIEIGSIQPFTLSIQVTDIIGREVAIGNQDFEITPGVQVLRYKIDLPYGVYIIQLLDYQHVLKVVKLVVVSN